MSTKNIDPKIEKDILKCEESIKKNLNQLIDYLNNKDEVQYSILYILLENCTFCGSMNPVSNKISGELKNALEKYRTWLQERFSRCTEILISFLVNNHSKELQEASFCALFSFLSIMTDPSKYDENEILLRIVSSLFKREEHDPLPEGCKIMFLNEYYSKYEDIKYYTLKYYYNILQKFDSSSHSSNVIENPKKKRKINENATSNSNNNNKEVYDIEKVIEIGYKLLTIKHTILKDDELPLTLIDLPRDIKKTTLKFLNQSSFKSLYSNCWISYLSLPLSQILSSDILYNLVNPLLLSDFLTKCYSIGGYYSLLSLESLYILMNEYGLDYPLFYNQLYHILEPSLFMMKNKTKFLNLLNLFLMSSHLSANMIMSFIKRLSHISLFVPPDILLFILPVIYNLIIKHQPAYSLLHRDNDNDKKSFFERLKKKIESIDKKMKNKQSNGDNVDDDEENENENNNENNENIYPSPPPTFEVNDLYKSDPYNYSLELGDGDTNAGNSSLWELESLLNHYLSDVTLFTRNFQKKLEVSYYNVSNYCDGSYSSLIVDHMKMDSKQKNIPLNFTFKEEFFPLDSSLANSFSFA